MRTFGLLAWLMVPVLVGAYHYGPGQEKLKLDDVSRMLAEADPLAGRRSGRKPRRGTSRPWRSLPAGRVDEARRIRLQRAKVQMLDHQLPEASAALTELVDQLEADKAADPAAPGRCPDGPGQRPVLHDLADAARGAGRRRVGARDRGRPSDLPDPGRAGRGARRRRRRPSSIARTSRVPSGWPVWTSASSRASTSPSSARAARAASARSRARSRKEPQQGRAEAQGRPRRRRRASAR